MLCEENQQEFSLLKSFKNETITTFEKLLTILQTLFFRSRKYSHQKATPETNTCADINQNMSAASVLPQNNAQINMINEPRYEVNIIAIAGVSSHEQVPSDGSNYEDLKDKEKFAYESLNKDEVAARGYQSLGDKPTPNSSSSTPYYLTIVQ